MLRIARDSDDDEEPDNRSLLEPVPVSEGSDFENGVWTDTAVLELRGELFSGDLLAMLGHGEN